jgi:hypothetical protein
VEIIFTVLILGALTRLSLGNHRVNSKRTGLRGGINGGTDCLATMMPGETVVKQWIVYSDKTDAYTSDISMETYQPPGRETPTTFVDCL